MNRARRAMALTVATASTAVAVTACVGTSDSGDGGTRPAPKVGVQGLNPHQASDLKQGGTVRLSVRQWISRSSPNQVDGTQDRLNPKAKR
ncbi:hypothetical protein [Streptomyces sp. NPDC050504]|uniref:hypothetical protein n=1 Tax=Streptomyces sp. NPDC050504 TaxID=3365618 RepID=UPI0037ADA5D4